LRQRRETQQQHQLELEIKAQRLLDGRNVGILSEADDLHAEVQRARARENIQENNESLNQTPMLEPQLLALQMNQLPLLLLEDQSRSS
jgi:hypothetical protein